MGEKEEIKFNQLYTYHEKNRKRKKAFQTQNTVKKKKSEKKS